MDTCVFCKIRDGQIPAMRVYEDERTLCIMDINPLSPGHCLVLTKAHAVTLYEVDTADLQAALQPEGLNVLQANGPAAFQSVPHFHLHLIPRWMRDGKGFDWKLVPGQKDEIVKTGDKLRAALGGGS